MRLLLVTTTVISLSLANGISDYYWFICCPISSISLRHPIYVFIQFSGFAFESSGHGQWLADDLHHVLVIGINVRDFWQKKMLDCVCVCVDMIL